MQLALPLRRIATTLPPHHRVGDWRVLGTLGRGGASTVYEVRHEATGVNGAMKVIDTDMRHRSDLRLRFAQEVEVLCRMDTEHVPRVLDVGDLDDGSPWVVMEALRGQTLESRLARGTMSIAAVHQLAGELLRAVAAIHRQGVVHRDLKPANIFLHREPDGRRLVKLVDFGICLPAGDLRLHSCLTRDDVLLGTACYVAPEQLRDDALDARADLYSVGAILYECLTGKPPFDGDTWAAVAVAALQEEPVPIEALRPSCPREFAHFVMVALARSPEQRHRSAVEMLAALEDVRVGRMPAHPDHSLEPPRSSRPPNWGDAVDWNLMVVLAIAGALLATLATLVFI